MQCRVHSGNRETDLEGGHVPSFPGLFTSGQIQGPHWGPLHTEGSDQIGQTLEPLCLVKGFLQVLGGEGWGLGKGGILKKLVAKATAESQP